jgi:hypothetical protein
MQVKEAWRMMKRHGLNELAIDDDEGMKKAYCVLCGYFESGMADDVDMEAPEE